MQQVKIRTMQLLLTMFVVSLAATAYAETENTTTPTVNINEASEAELAYLPGVGPATAHRIAQYRAKQPFKKVQHLMRVKGIGRKTFLKIQPFISTKGSTSATKKIKNSK